MKKILFFTIVIFTLFSCTENERAKYYGGTMTYSLEKNEILINETWKEGTLWVLTLDNEEKLKIAESILGTSGRLISMSKSAYRGRNPTHLVIFNSNICTESEKIWYGDLDVTLDFSKLQNLAKKISETIYVLYEFDARFENEENPLLNRAAIEIYPDGTWQLGESEARHFKNFPEI